MILSRAENALWLPTRWLTIAARGFYAFIDLQRYCLYRIDWNGNSALKHGWRTMHRGLTLLGWFIVASRCGAAIVYAADAVPDLMRQTLGQANAKSQGCVNCHRGVGDIHSKPTVHLGCTDCHGGNANATTADLAHVHPLYPDAWPASGKPVRSYTLLNHESPEFIKFVNPGDLRVAAEACGSCHPGETRAVRKSMMTHGCMLWGAALYNNGAVPFKAAHYGESYSRNGTPQRMQTVPPPTVREMDRKGVVPYLDPLPRFEISQPGNVLRIFERGGGPRPETGIPDTEEVNGQPRARLSDRGLGTENRTDPVFLGLQKTRLLDPDFEFLRH